MQLLFLDSAIIARPSLYFAKFTLHSNATAFFRFCDNRAPITIFCQLHTSLKLTLQGYWRLARTTMAKMHSDAEKGNCFGHTLLCCIQLLSNFKIHMALQQQFSTASSENWNCLGIFPLRYFIVSMVKSCITKIFIYLKGWNKFWNQWRPN